MLTCKVGKNIINTFEYKKEKIREWSKKGMLKCPVCGEKMIYCHGDFKTPYFRHEKDSDCQDVYSEGITEEHLKGTKILYEWLKNQPNVSNLQLEKWIEETRQRPDIYFEIDNNKYVIEFQCSPISTKYNDRRDLYRLNNINDIWILGMDKYDIGKYKPLKNLNAKNLELFDLRVKTIEKEISYSDNSLLYLSNDGFLIKLIGELIPIYDYKTKFNEIVDIKNVFDCDVTNIINSNSLYNEDDTYLRSVMNKMEQKVECLNSVINSNKYKGEMDISLDKINVYIKCGFEKYVYTNCLERFDENDLNKSVNNELENIKKEFEHEFAIKNKCKLLNDQFNIVNKNCSFTYSKGNGDLYLWKIIFDCDSFDCTFFIKDKQTDMTEEDSYTQPFRGKKGGTGWRRVYYHKTIDKYEYPILDINNVFNYISDKISTTLRKYRYGI